MIDIAKESERLLSAAEYAVTPVVGLALEAFCFENESLIGFISIYDSVNLLIERWRDDSKSLFKYHEFAFRKAGLKAWNAYSVFLSGGTTDTESAYKLNFIEEDLSGTRKIACGDIFSVVDLKWALMPLLPVQNPPILEAVDVSNEIRSRASDVPPSAIEAFLSQRPYDEIISIFENVR